MSLVEVVDPTRLRASLQCLRLYYLEQERNITTIKPKLALEYGVGVHHTLAHHYLGEPAAIALSKFEEHWEQAVIPYQTDMDEEDPKRNVRRWAEQFVLYRQHYRVEPWKVFTLPSGRPAVEVPFFLQLTDNLALAGIIDLIIEYLGQIMLVDHKTTSYLNQKWVRSFNPNHQFSAYLLAANELLKPAKPITTLWINAIQVHAKEMRPEKMFDRIPTTRNPAQLNEFREEITSWWNLSVRTARECGSWPRNDDRCERWPDGCPFKDLCTDVSGVDYRRLVPSPALYKTKIWDPIKNLRQHGLELPEGLEVA